MLALIEMLLHVSFKSVLVFCFLKTKLCCVCFLSLPFVCWWLQYYSFRDIVFWLCFSVVCWLGYFLFGWGRCMYWLSRSTDSIILFMICWHWSKCYCMCRLSLCRCSVFCKQNFVVFVFGGFHLFVDGYIAWSFYLQVVSWHPLFAYKTLLIILYYWHV